MHIDWWTLGLQTINVLVLVWILSRFLFRPITAIVEKRQAAATMLLDDARAARAEAVAERESARLEAAHLADSRADAMRVALAESETEKAALLAAARGEVNQMRIAAAAEIARARGAEDIAVADRASRLAVDIATRLLDRLPPDARIAGFVDGLAAGLVKLPEPVLAAMGGDGKPIHLTAARALTVAESEACSAALAGALGRKVDVVAEIDPALIAGIEIDTRHATVRNSFRADLDRIAAELTRHDVTGA